MAAGPPRPSHLSDGHVVLHVAIILQKKNTARRQPERRGRGHTLLKLKEMRFPGPAVTSAVHIRNTPTCLRVTRRRRRRHETDGREWNERLGRVK